MSDVREVWRESFRESLKQQMDGQFDGTGSVTKRFCFWFDVLVLVLFVCVCVCRMLLGLQSFEIRSFSLIIGNQ